MTKPAHVERMVEEYQDLDVRTKALELFIHTNPIFDTLDKEERIRMIEQLAHMKSYRSVLDSRIWVAHNPNLPNT